jgi:hypothetical protein
MKNLTYVFLAFLLAACTSTGGKFSEGSFRDATVTVPAQQFEDNETAKSVMVGSAQLAKDSNCTFMQRYKITTNQNFTSTVNLFKYRAALMGAERVAIIKHEEVDAKEEKFAKSDVLYVKEGSPLNGADYQIVDALKKSLGKGPPFVLPRSSTNRLLSLFFFNKHLPPPRCFFICLSACVPNRKYRQENRPHRPSLLLAPTLSRWKADCFSVIQRSTISPLYRLRFATT